MTKIRNNIYKNNKLKSTLIFITGNYRIRIEGKIAPKWQKSLENA